MKKPLALLATIISLCAIYVGYIATMALLDWFLDEAPLWIVFHLPVILLAIFAAPHIYNHNAKE